MILDSLTKLHIYEDIDKGTHILNRTSNFYFILVKRKSNKILTSLSQNSKSQSES